MNFTLNRKLPLSPYSMFCVLPERGSDDHDYPSWLAQFRLIGTSVIALSDGEYLIGKRGGNGLFNGYNPFDLYVAAERARDKPQPPHLVFAKLDHGSAVDACAFLNAYGPLIGTNHSFCMSEDSQIELEKAAPSSPSPEEYFRCRFGVAPLLPHPPEHPDGEFWGCQVVQFWQDQSEFELTLRLSGALLSQRDKLDRIQQVLAKVGKSWKIAGRNVEQQHVNRAREFVRASVNKHLVGMCPKLAIVPYSTAVKAVWGCYTLLQAMYLMLFLDIEGSMGRIAQCEKCSSLFYTSLDRGRYCSHVCENRDRALRAYHKKKKRKGGS